MVRRGKTGIGLGALDVISYCLGILGDGFGVAGDSKVKVTPVDSAGSTSCLIHLDGYKMFQLCNYVDVDEEPIMNIITTWDKAEEVRRVFLLLNVVSVQ